MNTTDRQKIIVAYRRGDIRTDSDIFDLAESLGYSEKTVSKVVFQEMAAGTSCAGCKNIESRFFNSPAWPCSKCTRRDPELKDMFELE
mgnify:CR=1 FL=1